MDLSVVIACYDGLPWLTQQLDTLAAEDPGVPWEVVVADNGSADASLTVVRSYADRLPVRVVDASDRPGPAHARNVGVAASGGDALVFLDQDDVISPGYLRAMVVGMAAHQLVAGHMDCASLNPGWAGAREVPWLAEGAQGFAAGAVLGMRRSLFDRLGGFDESLGVGDDVDICRRAHRDAEVTIHVCSDAVLRYRYRTRLADILRQGIRYGDAAVALDRRWHPEYTRDHVGCRVWLGVCRRLLTARSPAARRSAVFVFGRWVGTARARRG